MSTPDDQLHQLDQRAAGAATDLRDQAAARPVPAFDPHRAAAAPLAAPTSGRRRLLAVAAMVLVIAATAGVLIARGGNGDDDKATVISGDPRPFVAGDLPKGFQLAGVAEIEAEQQPRGIDTETIPGPMTVYGPSDDDPQLGISTYPSWDPNSADYDDVPTVAVGDRTAYVYDGRGIGNQALIVPAGDGAVAFMARTVDDAALQTMAEAVSADGRGRPVVGDLDLPDGWKELGQVARPYQLASPALQATGWAAAGSYATYLRGGSSVESGDSSDKTTTTTTPPDQGEGLIQISSTAGDEGDVRGAAVVAGEAKQVTVRGHDAVLTTPALAISGEDHRQAVAWVERPGEVLAVASSGISEAELLAVAEDVEPVDAAAWKDLAERSQMGEFDLANADEPMPTKVAEGRFPDGTRWLLSATGSGGSDASANLSVAVAERGDSDSAHASGSGTSMGGGDGPDTVFGLEVITTSGRSFVGALVADDVARVEQRRADGSVEARPEVVEGGGYRGFATEVTSDTRSFVAFAADGTELGSVAISIGSTHIGDPDRSSETTIASSTDPGSSSGSSSGPGSSGGSGN